MKGSEDNLEDIVSLLDLDRKGVKVVVKDNLRVMRTKAAGHYAPWSDFVSVNRVVVPYWFATYTTLLYECHHRQQRTTVIMSYTLLSFIGLGTWYYSIVRDVVYVRIIPVLCLVLVMCMHLFFEKDARRYERGHLPDVWFILTVLEYALVAHSLDALRKRALKI